MIEFIDIEVGKRFGFDMDTPVQDFTEKMYNVLLYGSEHELYDVERWFGGEAHRQKVRFEGIVKMIENRIAQSGNDEYFKYSG